MLTAQNVVSTPTLYTLPIDEIESLLLKREEQRFLDLGRQLAGYATPDDKIRFLQGDRARLRRVFECARFTDFHVEKAEADGDWRWTLKMMFEYTIRKVHHGYTLHLCLNPEKHFDRLDDLDDQIRHIQEHPTLLPDEDAAKIADVKERQRIEVQRFTDLQAECVDISFDASVRKNEYKDIKAEDEFGEQHWIDGTVITFQVPAFILNLLNDRRMHLDAYAIRLDPK